MFGKRIARALLPVVDILLLPLLYPAALLLKAIRRVGVRRMPFGKRALMQVGLFPIRNHYYEPLFDGRSLKQPLDRERNLPGIDWNADEQIALLRDFRFHDELQGMPMSKGEAGTFHFNNGAFEAGDAEFFHNMIRLKKPARIFEIGSGYSTLIAMKAIGKNREENPGYRCKHLCIEPYEAPWLEKAGATVLRKRVEELPVAFFSELARDDILFIDSSHIIRPQGDLLFEYLELLPSLNDGVIVHIHDIFSPRDYPKEWVIDEVLFWNEQYLLEAFLTGNRTWKIVGALNYLHHRHFDRLREKSPYLTRESEPRSFYIRKVAGESE